VKKKEDYGCLDCTMKANIYQCWICSAYSLHTGLGNFHCYCCKISPQI